jgi:hypothetical protein
MSGQESGTSYFGPDAVGGSRDSNASEHRIGFSEIMELYPFRFKP